MAASRDRTIPLFTRTEKYVVWAVGSMIVLALLGLFTWHSVVVRVPPGQVGVRYSLLFGGTVTSYVLREGIALKLPWDNIYFYEVRIQRIPFEVSALSKEGMMVSIKGVIIYRPREDQVGVLQKTIGPNYRERIVKPVALDAIREVAAQFNSHELYTIDYEDFKNRALQLLQADHAGSLIDFSNYAITQIGLPAEVTRAIEEKLTQEQYAAAYEYRLEAAVQEAKRKRIEAIGIRSYLSIVSQALDQELLTWAGIQATVELAQSPNTKVVIVGGGEDQLPLILGSDIANAPSRPEPVSDEFSPDDFPLPDLSKLPSLFSDITSNVDTSGVHSDGVSDSSR